MACSDPCVPPHRKLFHRLGSSEPLGLLASEAGLPKGHGCPAKHFRPQLTLLLGDFNCTATNGSPLDRALAPGSSLEGYKLALPLGTPTNFVKVQGRVRSTAIDHALWNGEASKSTAHTLPMPGSHLAIHLTLDLDSVAADPSHWRLFRWRKITDSNLAILARALDLVWGVMAWYNVAPDSFAAALHRIAPRFVPIPRSVAATLAKLHRPRPLGTEEELTQWAAAVEATNEATAKGLHAEALRTVDVTSFTRQALRLPSTSMGPFSGLRSSAQPEDLSPSEHRSEVSRQAAAVVESRHVRVPIGFFLASRDLHRWEFASHPLSNLPMSVLLDLLRRGLDPEQPTAKVLVLGGAPEATERTHRGRW